ncbi:MAG: PDZ domain-containing protein [Oscillospiraceae bacterium]|nr:PDZ domain-containing protein [Oscillospiraceae bacterium]
MKNRLLDFGSHLLVAVLSTIVTLVMVHVQGGGLVPSKLEQLETLIEDRFIGEAESEALEDAAAEAMVKATGDRWSYYIPATEYEAYRERMDNAYVGVGITIQPEAEQGFRIVDVAVGGPAGEAGLQVKDLLVKVAGQDIREMDVSQVRDLVKGKTGTYVELTVLRQEEELTLSVERRKVETPVANCQMLEDNVGLITIENFDSRCAEESIVAIGALREQGAEKLIFDVRHNPGGFADELVDLLDYLLPEGDLFRTVRYDGKENVDKSDADFLDMPMAVLVNSGSYSAAEFFAAALREYEAAIVVGEQTVGKGYFQTTYRLQDGSAVSLSIGKYFTPKGVSLAETGVTPDVVISLDEATAAELYYGTLEPKDDPQIQAAIDAMK